MVSTPTTTRVRDVTSGAALDRAIAAAEFEEAEVRGKGAVPSPLLPEPFR